MNKVNNIDANDLIFQNQLWAACNKKLFSDFLKWQKANHDFWNDLTPAQRREIDEAIAEIERGETTDYETFMAKHRN